MIQVLDLVLWNGRKAVESAPVENATAKESEESRFCGKTLF